jgi:hypothetical protein
VTEPEQWSIGARRQALQDARRSRAAILELAVRAEYLLDEALSNSFATNERAAVVLQEHMLWRVPIEVKLKLLSQVLDAYDISDAFPFVTPVLSKIFQIRNILAHSLETPAESEREIGFVSVHRGRVANHAMKMDALDWIWKQGDEVFGELWIISGVLKDLSAYENGEPEGQYAQAEDNRG